MPPSSETLGIHIPLSVTKVNEETESHRNVILLDCFFRLFNNLSNHALSNQNIEKTENKIRIIKGIPITSDHDVRLAIAKSARYSHSVSDKLYFKS